MGSQRRWHLSPYAVERRALNAVVRQRLATCIAKPDGTRRHDLTPEGYALYVALMESERLQCGGCL